MRAAAIGLGLAVAFGTPALAADGLEIFKADCGTCHFLQRDPARMDEMTAPPIDMMSARLRQVAGNDRAAFVQRVVAYVKAPAADKSVDPAAIQRFGLMPAIGTTFPDLTDADLAAVAGWMFDAHANVRIPPGRMGR